ncbi:MAG: SH3 domain-containing protein [Proteobacteria bacterium]|nr:SH3 domain-containing protein [Pseudomonadota bacterium]
MKKFFSRNHIVGLTLLILPLILLNSASYASKLEKENYFASLRAGKVNVRAGPGINYPIKHSFRLRGIPVKVISRYDNWNEIEDYEGDSGWINRNLLTRKRTAIVTTKKKFINLHLKPMQKSRVLARLENNVILDLLQCNDNWCWIKVEGQKGWVNKKSIWGDD